MKRNHTLVAATVIAAAIAVLVTTRVAHGEEEHEVQPQGGSILSMAQFYTGTGIGRTGDFPGKFVCLRCDLKPGPNAMAQCQKEGHRHALAMEDEGMIHPLLAGSDKVLEQINSGELHGKDVSVHGKYYPSTGGILVDRISTGK